MADLTGIRFSDAEPGDRIRFTIRDTGFGGCGLVYRTGTVTGRTDKTVTLTYGNDRTARIRRADWHERCLGKVVDAQPTALEQ